MSVRVSSLMRCRATPLPHASRPRWRRTLQFAAWALGAVLLWSATLAGCIVAGGQPNPDARADAALVLGAAVWNGRPSPVFAERIHHAITLYQLGQVRSLVFTGGVGNGDTAAEGAVAARYAIARGVPAEAVLVEAASRTTWDNLALAQPLLTANGLRSVVIVSDPHHLRRAGMIARRLGLEHVCSPTPSTRYVGWAPQARQLARELYFTTRLLLWGP